MRLIRLDAEHAVGVVGLLVALVYVAVIYWKASLNIWDAVVLTLIYVAYLVVLTRVPPQEEETIDELELIPRTIVKSAAPVRTTLIIGLFVAGGVLIYFTAEPFLGSLLAISAVLG